MIAALPMYDRPEIRAANDRLWQAVRDHLGYGPETLTRDRDPWEIWQAPDLLLSQTCGLPYRARLHGHVRLVGTPDYGIEGCPPGHYVSALVVRQEDSRDSLTDYATTRLAYNEPLSQSGWAAPHAHAARAGVAFSDTLRTGSHAASARAVAEGRADIAALDILTWRMITRLDSFAERLRVLDLTAPTPALPYITASDGPAEALFEALSSAFDGIGRDEREQLGLTGLTRIAAEAYLALPLPPPPPA